MALLAVKADPRYALGYALVAHTLIARNASGWSTEVSAETLQAHEAVMRALSLDGNDPQVLATVGQVYSYLLRQPEKGLGYFARSISLNPNLAAPRYWSGYAYLDLGEIERAKEQFESALRLSPLDPRIFLTTCGLAFVHFHLKDFAEAERWATLSTQQRHNYPPAWRVLCASLAMQGKVSEARAAMAEGRRVTPDWRLTTWRRDSNWRREEEKSALEAAFRIAGLPE